MVILLLSLPSLQSFKHYTHSGNILSTSIDNIIIYVIVKAVFFLCSSGQIGGVHLTYLHNEILFVVKFTHSLATKE